MRVIEAEFSPSSYKPREEKTLQQKRAEYKKFGRLSVLYLHKKVPNSAQKVDCVCECGRIVTFNWAEVKYKKRTNCGRENCLWTRIDNAAKKEEKDARTPAIVDRLHAKWYCTRPEEACLWSATCNICCAECDKKICNVRCANNPVQCGGAKRRKNK